VRPADNQVDDLLSEISQRVARQERVLATTLTKRMAEDLTDYLSDHGVRVRYLHSEIETVERVEIIRDLRKGVFDVLIGINLLREGLDMPEVSLVAILDADKEGFLRSDRSLIQTIGRASRNLHGKAILYANKVTRSMQKAIDETKRRRQRQLDFNKKHGITPASVVSKIHELRSENPDDGLQKVGAKVADLAATYHVHSPQEAAKMIKKLERKMNQHARDLEFEEAARIRDEIQSLRELAFKA